jgi:hypothetical protein
VRDWGRSPARELEEDNERIRRRGRHTNFKLQTPTPKKTLRFQGASSLAGSALEDREKFQHPGRVLHGSALRMCNGGSKIVGKSDEIHNLYGLELQIRLAKRWRGRWSAEAACC